jgi:hypothetical protein
VGQLTQLGWIGVWLLVVSVVAIAVEGVIVGLWSRRIATDARALSERLAAERALLQADVVRLQAALVEMRLLWQPYRRVLRWLRHPLVVALMQSYARRRAAAR